VLALRELQRTVAAAILSGDVANAASLLGAADRLTIHRNTMLTALGNALALTYPAVEALVGPEFFAQAARAFIEADPPRMALLTGYGAGFPAFLAGYAPAAGLSYLPDVARLEWIVEQAARAPETDDAPPLADIDLGGTRLALVPSLALLQTAYPVEPIWRAALENDGDALERLGAGPAISFLTIWRAGDGAAVRSLGPAAFAFLQELIAGGDASAAINAAAAADPANDPIAAITAQILPAGFARLTPST
jgi:hypothetical protein